MVSIGTKGFKVNLGCWQAAMATIIVSPTARDMAKTQAAQTPEKAAGRTILKDTCSRLEPKAYPASRKPIGTAWKASSLRDEIKGIIIIPITNPPERELNPLIPGIYCFNNGVTNKSAK